MIEEFKKKIKPYLDSYHSIDIRILCCQRDQKWVSLATRIFFDYREKEDIDIVENLPILPNFRAFHLVVPIGDLDNILEHLNKGIVNVDNLEICHGSFLNNQYVPNFLLRVYHWSLSKAQAGYDYKTVILRGHGESVSNLLSGKYDELDWNLKSLDIPYSGLEDLAKNFIMIKGSFDGSNSSYVEVLAPANLRFTDSCQIKEDILKIELESVGRSQIQDAKLGMIRYSQNGHTDRSSVKLHQNEWYRIEDRLNLTKEIEVRECLLVDVFLSIQEETVDLHKFYSPVLFAKNPRILAHNYLDDGLEIFKEYIGGGEGKGKSKNFVIGISWLLNFCGFLTAIYDLTPQTQEGIDIIAFSPIDNDLIAAECTLSLPDTKDKMSKLVNRTKELSKRVQNFKILPAIFTPLERENIPRSEIIKARDDRIALISIEEILNILRMAEEHREVSEILRYIETLIPVYIP